MVIENKANKVVMWFLIILGLERMFWVGFGIGVYLVNLIRG